MTDLPEDPTLTHPRPSARSSDTESGTTVRNPILRGFHPDPSILRYDGAYYIASSTFDWFPGVRIHRSTDLATWTSVGYALDRVSQLDMLGNPNSGGVWAPDLSASPDGGVFLVFTNMRSWGSRVFDAPNYVVHADRPEGPWSEPHYLNSSGFDPSLFHDQDGRSWLLNMLNDFRREGEAFGGIVMQELDRSAMRLVGEPRVIFRGTEADLTEGPHVYRHEGRYYLITAEGGTLYEHQVTVARSERLEGPYEADPAGPVLTASDDPNLALQKAGHASLVETPDGTPYLAYLCGRPLVPRRLCPLGRETALARAEWTPDGWLRLAGGGHAPRVEVDVAVAGLAAASSSAASDAAYGSEAPTADASATSTEPASPWPSGASHAMLAAADAATAAAMRDDTAPDVRRPAFEQVVTFAPDVPLPDDFQTLRVPLEPSWADLRVRPGWLRLTGRESLASHHRQSLVARRRQAFACEAETAVEAEPRTFQHMAGLVAFYDTRNFVYLHLTLDERRGPVVALLQAASGKVFRPQHEPVAVPAGATVRLRMRFERARLVCSCGTADDEDLALGPVFDSGLLSDEHDGLGFTGTFVGVAAQDLAGSGFTADFGRFVYREQAER